MVEMVETAAILNQATARSLVILDEIGRGTATFDGLSIAYACVEHLSAVNRSRALFATHFHELTSLAETLPRLVNLTMRVTEFKGTLAFLYEVVHGAADRSYGIQVAKLAGLPSSVVKRARQVLASLEASRSSGSLDALPLFSYEPREPPAAPPPDELRTVLMALDPDALTPRDALEALYKLRRLIDGAT
jgi:DNA mismatch repair protein MutS